MTLQQKKDEYEYLYKKDDKLKGNGNQDIIEYGNDFKKCKIFRSKQ